MSELRVCETDGFFEGTECPDCGTSGRKLLSTSERRQVSKFLSGALRHFPDDAGLTLDAAGWADWQTVVDSALAKYEWLDVEAIDAVVQCDPKGRFETENGRIRAAYGHSVEVSLATKPTSVPETLYHGTSPDAYKAIRTEGLVPMTRQAVHLSGDIEPAREVGRRHANEPVVLAVDATDLQTAGHEVTKRGESVYTTDYVPPTLLCRIE